MARWTSGFCGIGNHRRCRGAVRNLGKFLRCNCRECRHTPERCIDCGNDLEGTVTDWTCNDPAACADAVATVSADNPLRKELELVRELGGEARRQALHKRLMRQIREDVEACGIDQEIGYDHIRGLGRPRVPKIKPTGRCVCDCGEATRGGRFRPGHDAKLKARLRRAADEGDQAAIRRMIELGWTKFLPESNDQARSLGKAS